MSCDSSSTTSPSRPLSCETFPLFLTFKSRAKCCSVGNRTSLVVDTTKLVGSLVGSVSNVFLNVSFTLISGASNVFLPPIDPGPLLPNVTSHYGTLLYANVNGTQYGTGVAAVYTKYPVKMFLDSIEWSMISAQSFTNSDLRIEVTALHTPVLDAWICNAFVYYRGRSFQLDNPALFECTMHDTGALNNATMTRSFSATLVNLIPPLHIRVNCSAPEKQFAVLDQEGATFIHTTVLGKCEARDVTQNKPFQTLGATALLERKAVPLR